VGVTVDDGHGGTRSVSFEVFVDQPGPVILGPFQQDWVVDENTEVAFFLDAADTPDALNTLTMSLTNADGSAYEGEASIARYKEQTAGAPVRFAFVWGTSELDDGESALTITVHDNHPSLPKSYSSLFTFKVAEINAKPRFLNSFNKYYAVVETTLEFDMEVTFNPDPFDPAHCTLDYTLMRLIFLVPLHHSST
jgi:hypothetical protein